MNEKASKLSFFVTRKSKFGFSFHAYHRVMQYIERANALFLDNIVRSKLKLCLLVTIFVHYLTLIIVEKTGNYTFLGVTYFSFDAFTIKKIVNFNL